MAARRGALGSLSARSGPAAARRCSRPASCRAAGRCRGTRRPAAPLGRLGFSHRAGILEERMVNLRLRNNACQKLRNLELMLQLSVCLSCQRSSLINLTFHAFMRFLRQLGYDDLRSF